VAGWTDSVVSTGCAERSATREAGCSLVLLSSITVRAVARELSPCSVRVVGWNVCIGSGLRYLISCGSRILRQCFGKCCYLVWIFLWCSEWVGWNSVEVCHFCIFLFTVCVSFCNGCLRHFQTLFGASSYIHNPNFGITFPILGIG